ncbi:unnamed protein product [Durusdinium trenchii]|uniref:Uncharacterized protein n=1 Tax=Durusdinium trenchii TaxID=1381693 RepID=A0ABP0PH66_9DINO
MLAFGIDATHLPSHCSTSTTSATCTPASEQIGLPCSLTFLSKKPPVFVELSVAAWQLVLRHWLARQFRLAATEGYRFVASFATSAVQSRPFVQTKYFLYANCNISGACAHAANPTLRQLANLRHVPRGHRL